MSKYIDARGKACPMPVVLAKKELDLGEKDITITVDNEIAVENLKRLASDSGIKISVKKVENDFEVSFAGGALAVKDEKQQICNNNGCGYSVFFGKDYVGEGDYTLGNNLAKMMLYTLAQGDDIPAYVIFMNSGVKLPTTDKLDVIMSLNTLIDKGTQILVCGTCLNYYGLTDELKIGIVSNMYEILEKLHKSSKIIYA